MLGFFRKHQRYFFIVTTVIIVISFTFFGTYSTLSSGPATERTAFIAVDGERVGQWELDQMVRFISTDQETQRSLGTVWGPNFLNDGVLTKDFLRKGIAKVLVAQYPDQVGPELDKRLKREQKFAHYEHPSARFISAEGAWDYFAPQIKQALNRLAKSEGAADPEALQARIDLLLAQQEFPPTALKQLLRYQEQQYSWLPADPNLANADLSLFGYHTMDDWFGQRFIQLASMFIVNSAKLAEQQGYVVSQEEALADLVHNAELAFKARSGSAGTGMTGPVQYMREQLRRMGLEQSQAVWIWRNVLLFRRLFDSVGSAIFVDPLAFEQFNNFALESVTGDLYQLPQALELASFRDFQLFETYLDAVADRSQASHPLAFPTQFKSVQQVRDNYPELVHKRYVLQIAEVPLKSLHARIRVKQLWDWQIQEQNWQQLVAEFPELGVQEAKTENERFLALEELSDVTRSRVDEFSRATIVKAHPEWIEQALSEAESQPMTTSIAAKGGALPVTGVEDREELLTLLDTAPLRGQEAVSDTAAQAADSLRSYSPDNTTFYRIEVLERDPNWQLSTFGEARGGEALTKALQSKLEKVYTTVRSAAPEQYKKADQSWKPLEEVQELVAAAAFKEVMDAVKAQYSQHASDQASKKTLENRDVAVYRMLYPTRLAWNALKQEETDSSQWVAEKTGQNGDQLLPQSNLAQQWKLERSVETLRRSDDGSRVGDDAVFALSSGDWTAVSVKPNGRTWFFYVDDRSVAPSGVMTGQQMVKAQSALAAEAQRLLARSTLRQFDQKKAMTLVGKPNEAGEDPVPNDKQEQNGEL